MRLCLIMLWFAERVVLFVTLQVLGSDGPVLTGAHVMQPYVLTEGFFSSFPEVHSVIWNRQLIMQSRWWPAVDMSYMRVWVGSEKDSWQCIVLISPSAILHWKSTRWKVSRGKLCLGRREKCSLKHACGGGQCDSEASCVTRGAIKSLTAPVAASVAFLLVQLTFGAVASILKRLTWQLRMTTMHKIRLQVLPCGHFLS